MNLFGLEIKRKSLNGAKNIETVAMQNANGIVDMIDHSKYLGVFNPRVSCNNFVSMFEEVAEVFFPVDAIASRIVNGKFELKKFSDDSVVYNNDRINKFLEKPNFYQTFNEFVRQAICYKLVTGKSFIYGGVATEGMARNRWKYCDSYIVLPSQDVSLKYVYPSPVLTAGSIGEIIEYYSFSSGYGSIRIAPSDILHLKDICLKSISNGIEGDSRLNAVKYPLSNLLEAYEARNAIYVKRGAIGAIVGSSGKDEMGNGILTEKEKQELRDEYNRTYGLSNGRDAMIISKKPLSFIRFNMSIQELMPFDETLADAVQIAGIYNVPAVLIPRKDQATFSNQDSAEKSLYMNAVIPEAKSFVMALNDFLGLANSGLYLDVTFDHISVLQPNWKEKAETSRTTTDTCEKNFKNGIITLNEWRAALGMERIPEKIYDKYILQMEEDELKRISLITGTKLTLEEPASEASPEEQESNNSNREQNDIQDNIE